MLPISLPFEVSAEVAQVKADALRYREDIDPEDVLTFVEHLLNSPLPALLDDLILHGSTPVTDPTYGASRVQALAIRREILRRADGSH